MNMVHIHYVIAFSLFTVCRRHTCSKQRQSCSKVRTLANHPVTAQCIQQPSNTSMTSTAEQQHAIKEQHKRNTIHTLFLYANAFLWLLSVFIHFPVAFLLLLCAVRYHTMMLLSFHAIPFFGETKKENERK